MNAKLRAWLQAGGHLKAIGMTDFHAQKDLFKTIFETMQVNNDYCKDLNWAAAHVFTIDTFLWFMAKHGYTLQQNRAKLEFDNLYATIHAAGERRDKAFTDVLRLALNGRAGDE